MYSRNPHFFPLIPYLPSSLMQLLNEKINGAEGTKLDEEFLKMEKVGNTEVLM